MQEKLNETEFSKLVKRYSDSGLFTHVFAECGSLDSSKSFFSFFLSPDKREIFDLASMTKGLVTSPLIFNEVAKGLALESTIEVVLAGKKSSDLSPKLLNLTLHELLGHKSGLPWWRNFYVTCVGSNESDTEKKLVTGLNRAADQIDLRKKESYSDLGFLLLGLVLTRLNGKNLALQFEEFYKSGTDIGYAETISGLSKLAVPTSYCEIRKKKLCGEVHDENSAALGGTTGHSGLFGSGPGVAGYLRFLSSSPAGKLLISANSKAANDAKNVNQLIGLWRGTDFTNGAKGSFAIGHPGFTGTAFWMDPAKNSYSVLLTNRVISGRLPGSEIKTFRKEALSFLHSLLK
jgi:CubicO group peptidase (beta-lactamase class C family)